MNKGSEKWGQPFIGVQVPYNVVHVPGFKWPYNTKIQKGTNKIDQQLQLIGNTCVYKIESFELSGSNVLLKSHQDKGTARYR